ncbi:MAG: DUF4317 family protein [Eubacterium sp.]|nr:DUF4317 family protein [Eubacterium sp.]
MINRNDMLELTRRMTPARNCFARVAGAYMDEDGYDEGTFNIHFGKLKQAEAKRNLELAKAIPFAKTNEQLKEYRFPKGESRKESMWQLLLAMKNSGLKDDGLLSIFYEIVGENYDAVDEYSIFLFYGSYDVPTKGTDGEWLEGSEEVYDFIVCAISPLEGEYEPGKPEFGFLFPAFVDRSSDSGVIDIFNADPDNVQTDLMEKILGSKIML